MELCSVLDVARDTILLTYLHVLVYSLRPRLPGQLSRRLEAARAVISYEDIRRPLLAEHEVDV